MTYYYDLFICTYGKTVTKDDDAYRTDAHVPVRTGTCAAGHPPFSSVRLSMLMWTY
jgi:hypothetical protein